MGGFLLGTYGTKIIGSSDAKKLYTHCTAAALRAKDEVVKDFTVIGENCGDIAAAAKDINEKRNLVIVDVKRGLFKRFFDVLSTFRVREFEEKPFTLQDYFMSFYAEEKTFAGLSGVEENK